MAAVRAGNTWSASSAVDLPYFTLVTTCPTRPVADAPSWGNRRWRPARAICTMVAMDTDIADESWWKRKAAAQANWWKKRAEAHEEQSLRQNNMMYGGLIAIGVVLVQPFLTSGAASLDLSAEICVIAFSLAIPILSALLVLNLHETYRRRASSSVFVLVVQQGSLGLGYVGVVAGFWHIMAIAGIAILVATGLGVAVHGAGYVRVEEEDAQATSDAEQPPHL